ncbi:uncharacterized protein LOC119311152 isoform X2 [Triticum dicoccoides]|uniref:uncharacterized protein LOC119311152 isoform X2 n=1 Tax=Triticum dicoccoides TaxID=85692 RepID=UPI001890E22C|nr:uncharacterized protein LOC119311152 isoform X2 [Triticum dicoccoides]
MGAGYPPPPPPAPPDPCTTRPWRWLLPSPGIPAPPAMKGSSSSGRALQHRQPLSYSCSSTATPPSDARPWHADMPSRRKSFSLYLDLGPFFSVSSNWLSPLSFFGFHASTVRDLPPKSASAFLVGEACHRSSFQSKSDMGRFRARARQPLSNISMLALPRNQESHDRFPFFSSLPSVSSQDVTEMAMAARCRSTAGQGPAAIQTPSTPSPSHRRPAPSPIQRRRHPSAPTP